ncbi:MAG TPA: ATP-binding protein [Acidimicrobiales bacterium]|jgi:hypothetical protein
MGAETVSLDPVPTSCSHARHFVEDRLVQWQRTAFRDAAGLCATELVTNAILHARQPFVFTVRPAGEAVRIDVLDTCPRQLPITTPRQGSALDLTSWGTGGRGMQIIASLATRWGVTVTDEAKTVWVEVRESPTLDPPEPVMSMTRLPDPAACPEAISLAFPSLPVRAAVSSGIQTEEVIRDFQLDQVAASTASRSHDQEHRFFELADRSAPVRLSGRHAALRAAGAGQSRFDLSIRATPDSLRALGDFSRLLADYRPGRDVPFPHLTDDVIAFRAWVAVETARQQAGQAPMRCPLP